MVLMGRLEAKTKMCAAAQNEETRYDNCHNKLYFPIHNSDAQFSS
jgi:hypothetical protein